MPDDEAAMPEIEALIRKYILLLDRGESFTVRISRDPKRGRLHGELQPPRVRIRKAA